MVQFSRTLSILMVISLLLCLALTGCAKDPLSLEINSPEDGSELSWDLLKVIGTVSHAEASVTVNGVEAQVAEDGTFFAYVELREGENLIKAIATLNGKEATTDITCTSSLKTEAQVTWEQEIQATVNQEFDIDLEITLRLGSDWEESHDDCVLALIENTYYSDDDPQSVSGTRRFRFKPLKSGETHIIFTLIHETGPIFEQRIFVVDIM